MSQISAKDGFYKSALHAIASEQSTPAKIEIKKQNTVQESQVPRKSQTRMLSVDTGMRGMIRRQITTNTFLEQSMSRKQRNADAAASIRSGLLGLPAIEEQQNSLASPSGNLSFTNYSPTKFIKESLRLHGNLQKSNKNSPRGNAYDEFVEQNYRQNLQRAAYVGEYSESQASRSYTKKMKEIKGRSQRHANDSDLD